MLAHLEREALESVPLPPASVSDGTSMDASEGRGRRENCRLQDVVGVTAKGVQQARRCDRAERLVEPEPACDTLLQRRAEAVLRATGEEMQMTPHEPKKAVCLDQHRVCERGWPP